MTNQDLEETNGGHLNLGLPIPIHSKKFREQPDHIVVATFDRRHYGVFVDGEMVFDERWVMNSCVFQGYLE